MKHSGIYIIQSISNPKRIYVGSAVDLNDRKQMHLFELRRNKHTNSKLQRHFNKYGESDLVFEIIESEVYLGKNHLLSREQGWFDHFKHQGMNLPYFNIMPIAGSRLGVKQSEEQRKANGDRRRGTTHSKETKQLMREARLGVPQSEEHIKNASNSHKKPILQYDLTMNLIQEWPSATDAAKIMGVNKSSICGCCNKPKRNKTLIGYVWRYKNN